jgi:hypothetical protein
MSKPQLTEESVAHLAVALKALPENRETPLEALIQPACRYLLACREAARTEENNYQRERLEKRFKSKRLVSEAEIARLVTGDRHKDRAIDRFRDFVRFILSPDNELIWPSLNLVFLEQYLESRRWKSGWVDYLRKLFPEYQKLKRSISQPKTKKKKKVLALT